MSPMTVPRATATAGTASHSIQRMTRRRRERERSGGGACLRSLPCGLPWCWCLAARVGVIGGAAIARRWYCNRAGKPISADVAAAEQVPLGEVVPVAGGADLDHVAGD